MGIRALLSKPLASIVVGAQQRWAAAPEETQYRTLEHLIAEAKHTLFGKEHHFDSIQTYKDFQKQVPIRDYEQLSPYIKKVIEGKADVLWKGRPLYFAKTSGTTSGVKYI